MNTNEKLREALKELITFTCNSCEQRYCEDDCEEEDGVSIPLPCNAIIKAREAIALPRRNCDVGTANEQQRRFLVWCFRHADNKKCSNSKCRKCFAHWAQMPYEEKTK